MNWRRVKNWVGIGAIVVLSLFAVAPVLSVVVSIYAAGAAAIANLGGPATFLTAEPPDPFATSGGVGPLLAGTLYMTALGAAAGILVGFPVGIYIGEFKRDKLSHVARGAVNMLVEFPTIAMGLFVYGMFSMVRGDVNSVLAPLSRDLSSVLGGWVTWFVGPLDFYNAYIGAAALAIVMIPYVALFTASAYASIDQPLREAAYSLSGREYKAVFTVLRKVVWRAVLASFLLGTAKIAGETAPLFFTALGNHYYAPFTGPTGAVTLWIYEAAQSSYKVQVDSAYGAAAVLLTVVLALFILAKLLGRGR
jgi:phosphate transport system permease protein